MRELVWSEVLSVDVEEIDDDHRRLLDIINILNQAVADEESIDYVTAVLEELLNYTVYHFSHEERLMLKYDYDGYDEHKSEHEGLIGSARTLQDEILQENRAMAEEELKFLAGWLKEHLVTDDKKLGSFLIGVM